MAWDEEETGNSGSDTNRKGEAEEVYSNRKWSEVGVGQG